MWVLEVHSKVRALIGESVFEAAVSAGSWVMNCGKGSLVAVMFDSLLVAVLKGMRSAGAVSLAPSSRLSSSTMVLRAIEACSLMLCSARMSLPVFAPYSVIHSVSLRP